MSKVAVIMGADTRFGRALCKAILDQGGQYIGGGARQGESLASLSAGYYERFHAVSMSPQSLASIEAAAETVAATVGHVDLLVCNADQPAEDSLAQGLDFEAMKLTYDINGLGPIRFVEAFLPLMESGIKRLCFITDEVGSIALSTGKENFGYSMSKAALHMAVIILSNDLSRAGYTFRLYIPGEDEFVSASLASEYFIQDREDEFRVTIRDDQGEEWPF